MKRNSFSAAPIAVVLFSVAGPLAAQAFHKFVAVGDSLIAGEESGCLVERFQQRSWVRIAATQLGITDFQQPIISEKALSNPLTGQPCLGPVIVSGTISVDAVSQMGTNTNAALARPYDNLGIIGLPLIRDFVDLKTSVPGRSSVDDIAALIWRNFAGGPFEGKSAVDEANLLSPDLVAFWGGNNDVLGAVLTGVAIDEVTVTPVTAFEAKYSQVLTGLKASGRTLVTFTIPDVTSIAFTTTIPPVVVNPKTRQPVLVNGAPVPLLGSRPNGACASPPCPVPAGTLVTLYAASLLAQGIGIPAALGGRGLPLPDGSFDPVTLTLSPGVLLYPDEVALIRQRTDDLNAKIESVSSSNGAIVIDTNGIFKQIKANGYQVGGITLTADLLTGGILSYDGAHPSQIGYAIIADEFIKALNAAKGTTYERPNLSQALFTPNVPSPSSLVFPPEGFLEFSWEAWSNLLSSFSPSAGFEIVAPELLEPEDASRPVLPESARRNPTLVHR